MKAMAGVGWVHCRYVRLAAVPIASTLFHYRTGSFRGISAKRCHSASDPDSVIPKGLAIASPNPGLVQLRHAKTNLRNRRVPIISQSCKDNGSEVEMNKAELVA